MTSKKVRFIIGAGAVFAASTASAGYLEDLLLAAKQGQCVETVAAGMISGNPGDARGIVCAAYDALAQHGPQDGCDGNILEYAKKAGASEADVWSCAAMQSPGTAPESLQGIGGGSAGGGGGTVASPS